MVIGVKNLEQCTAKILKFKKISKLQVQYHDLE